MLVVNVGEVREAMVSTFPLSLKTQSSVVLSLSLSLSLIQMVVISTATRAFSGVKFPCQVDIPFLKEK